MNDLLEKVIWVAHTLFQRGLVTGSTGNISFLYDGAMYISKSGSCFGRLQHDSFAVVALDGTVLQGKPSKEYPMHLAMYQSNSSRQFVVHTHSTYITALSCRKQIKNVLEEVTSYTPYLQLLTKGNIGVVSYAPPGSEALFSVFHKAVTPVTNCQGLFNQNKDFIVYYQISSRNYYFLSCVT